MQLKKRFHSINVTVCTCCMPTTKTNLFNRTKPRIGIGPISTKLTPTRRKLSGIIRLYFYENKNKTLVKNMSKDRTNQLIQVIKQNRRIVALATLVKVQQNRQRKIDMPKESGSSRIISIHFIRDITCTCVLETHHSSFKIDMTNKSVNKRKNERNN